MARTITMSTFKHHASIYALAIGVCLCVCVCVVESLRTIVSFFFKSQSSELSEFLVDLHDFSGFSHGFG